MTPDQSTADSLEALHHSEQRLLRTVDSLADDQWAGASVLPGWTRAHVFAHLALNAEGLAGAVDGLAHDQEVSVYASQEQRSADIDDLAEAAAADIRTRLFAAGQALRDALASLTPEQWSGSVPRVPDGPDWAVTVLPVLRRREVEVHHADLDAGYGHRDWPADFCAELLDVVTVDHAGSPDSPDFAVTATDLDRTWTVGAPTPVVSGPAADLGWWLIGRGDGAGLSCDAGALPTLGPWRPTPAK